MKIREKIKKSSTRENGQEFSLLRAAFKLDLQLLSLSE